MIRPFCVCSVEMVPCAHLWCASDLSVLHRVCKNLHLYCEKEPCAAMHLIVMIYPFICRVKSVLVRPKRDVLTLVVRHLFPVLGVRSRVYNRLEQVDAPEGDLLTLDTRPPCYARTQIDANKP